MKHALPLVALVALLLFLAFVARNAESAPTISTQGGTLTLLDEPCALTNFKGIKGRRATYVTNAGAKQEACYATAPGYPLAVLFDDGDLVPYEARMVEETQNDAEDK